MSLATWLYNARIRRGLAASAVVLAAGGAVLYQHTPGRAASRLPVSELVSATPLGQNGGTFAGAGVHGSYRLSQTRLLAGAPRTFFAELHVVADEARGEERAPLALGIVLDTSGSMIGEKIQRAREAVLRLVGEMRDDDQVSIVRYADEATVVSPLVRVGDARTSIIEKVRAIDADGGTAIAKGLSRGLETLERATAGRVRRIVLLSDGLDNGRGSSEALAAQSFDRGIVVSSIGIGLDFDESYMGALARRGHGNFAFVNDGAQIESFMRRELHETAKTTVEAATVRFELPAGVRFVRAHGAEVRPNADALELTLGSLFAGDERRIVVELEGTLERGASRELAGALRWQRLAGGAAEVRLPRVELGASTSVAEVERSTDFSVLASATNVRASARQLEATEAYAQGDQERAQALMQDNVRDLDQAARNAPAPMASALDVQKRGYEAMAAGAAATAPTSEAGRALAKQATAHEMTNLSRPAAKAFAAPAPSSAATSK